jgi:hypothetical protein
MNLKLEVVAKIMKFLVEDGTGVGRFRIGYITLGLPDYIFFFNLLLIYCTISPAFRVNILRSIWELNRFKNADTDPEFEHCVDLHLDPETIIFLIWKVKIFERSMF